MNERFRTMLKQYMYYGIISMLVIIALVFLPMIDSSGKISHQIPSTKLGWVAYVVIRCFVGVIVFMIFISFDNQGKVNILQDERYLNAIKKLHSAKNKNYIPMSPAKYKLQTRGLKGMTLSASMIGTAFLVVDAILSYDVSILLAYGITIGMSLITGIFQMNKSSEYWTEEFPLWVDYYLDRIEKENDVYDYN